MEHEQPQLGVWEQYQQDLRAVGESLRARLEANPGSPGSGGAIGRVKAKGRALTHATPLSELCDLSNVGGQTLVRAKQPRWEEPVIRALKAAGMELERRDEGWLAKPGPDALRSARDRALSLKEPALIQARVARRKAKARALELGWSSEAFDKKAKPMQDEVESQIKELADHAALAAQRSLPSPPWRSRRR